MRQRVRKIGIFILAMGLLGGAAILAANLFPDDTYAVLQNVRAWIGTPANGLAQSPPAPRGIPIARPEISLDLVAVGMLVLLCCIAIRNSRSIATTIVSSLRLRLVT